MVIDFGNGLRAGLSVHDRSESVKGAIHGHSGAEVPDVELRSLESTLRGGGTIFGTRNPMRRVSFLLDWRGITRKELARAFVPGQKMTVSRITPAGGMLTGETVECFLPCTLDSVVFTSDNLNSTKMAISFVSEIPHPLATAAFITAIAPAGSGLPYPYDYPYSYETDPSVTVFPFMSDTEIDADPVITVTTSASAALLTITLNETFTLDISLIAGDVVRIDCANRTVTKNGNNAIASVSEQSEWPVVVPGNNTLTSTVAGVLSVSYEPRMVGLL